MKIVEAIRRQRLLIGKTESDLLALVGYARAADGNGRRFEFREGALRAWFSAYFKDGNLVIDYALRGNNHSTIPILEMDKRLK